MEKTAYTLCRIQQQISDFLRCNPGAHCREVSRRLNIPFSTVRYHLVRLEKQNILYCVRVGKYARYYVSGMIGVDERSIVSVLRNATQKQIIEVLLVNVAVSKEEVGNCLRRHPTTIMFHLNQLLERDIITTQGCSDALVGSKENLGCSCQTSSRAKFKRYRLKKPDLVAQVMQKYAADTCLGAK
ncbi:MAG: winged helix-turn-helix transcriptional regulator [Candidatus Thermoplasmatota archaeon]